jgi:spermidine synthase
MTVRQHTEFRISTQMVCVGLNLVQVNVSTEDLVKCLSLNPTSDFVCIQIPEPPSANHNGEIVVSPLFRNDLLLHSTYWRSKVVGKIEFNGRFEWIEKQVQWAAHVGIFAVWLDSEKILTNEFLQFSRVWKSVALKHSQMQFWISVGESEWNSWSRLYQAVDYLSNVGVFLRIGGEKGEGESKRQDDDEGDSSDLKRWRAEPIAAVGVSGNADIEVLETMMKYCDVYCIPVESFEETSKLAARSAKLKELKAALEEEDETSRFYSQLDDVLQTPLQPLKDDLDSVIYETFELDSPKYSYYQAAITSALMDTLSRLEEFPIRIAVVGAGRGPLIDAVIAAANNLRMGEYIEILALEKNPWAFNTLLHRNQSEWNEYVVELVEADVRSFVASCVEPGSFDILISELLGSFGDNELAPECLEAATELLKADGICIPQSYSSFLEPISSSILWNRARKVDALEKMYVVKMKNFFQVSKAPQLCFTFQHFSASEKESRSFEDNNSRFTNLKFSIESDCAIHGLAGYFSTKLFGIIELSTVPDERTQTKGLNSWFPVFFPLKTPLHVSKGTVINVSIWRCVDITKGVWYEWSVSSSNKSSVEIHNCNGNSYSVQF